MSLLRSTGTTRPSAWRRNHFEGVMAAFVIIGIIYCGWFLWQNGYLPPPFFYEPADTYADWFNTAYWARNAGTYDVWWTLYPPLSFVFIRPLGLDHCYPESRPYDFSAGLDARDCDWLGLAAIWVILAINVVLIWKTFHKLDPKTALARTICLGLGLPMIDAVERGNLVLISFTALILAFGPILRSARLRWLAAGLAVNFKVYLLAGIVPLLLKRRWRWVECALLSVVLVYLVSFAILGRGTLVEIYENIYYFASLPSAQITDQWYTTTYKSLLSLIEAGQFPIKMLVGSRIVEAAEFILPILQRFSQLMLILASVATALRPEAVPVYRVINFGILMALITSEPGGYTMMYFTLFVLMERWKGFAIGWAIVMCYILAIPLDIIIDKAPPVVRDLYVGDSQSIVTYYVTVGPFLRPLLIMTITWALSAATIRAVWRDVREQGWSERWRFRQDVPLLPWIKRPAPLP